MKESQQVKNDKIVIDVRIFYFQIITLNSALSSGGHAGHLSSNLALNMLRSLLFLKISYSLSTPLSQNMTHGIPSQPL